MSTLTADPPMTSPAANPPAAAQVHPTFAGVMRGEWIKLLSQRSTWWALASTAAVITLVALAAAMSLNAMTEDPTLAPGIEQMHGAEVIAGGFHFGMLTIAVLGALLITGEYATGMIRSTFTAVPRRLHVVGAKAAVFGVVALVAMTLASFAAFYGAQIFLGPHGHGSSISDPGALRSVAGAGLYLTLVGLLGAGTGWIVRSTAGAITALVGLLLILPNLIPLLGSWADRLTRYMPSNAGESFITSTRMPDALTPVTGIGVLTLWVAAAFVAAVVLVRRRDA